MTELHEHRLKRLKMRSMRRGIKEMDVILTRFADAQLAGLNAADLDLYDEMLWENDHDLLSWIVGTAEFNEKYEALRVRLLQSAEALI